MSIKIIYLLVQFDMHIMILFQIGRYPFVALHLNVQYNQINMNVHPINQK
ncbi:MAG: hypothetical protein ACR5KW_00920 [Wolbachia sp.]